MTNIGPISAFVVLAKPGEPYASRRISMTAQAQTMLGEAISEQLRYFVSEDLERVPFDPTYTTTDETVLWISGFVLPTHITDAITTPQEVPVLSSGESFTSVKAMFYVGADGNVFLQCWRNFSVMDRRKVWLLLSGETFDLAPDPPLVVERRLDAVYWDGDLLFRSYASTNAILNLLDYVSEATSEDIQQFAEAPIFRGNAETLAGCSAYQRRYIRLLVQGDALETLCQQSVEDLREKAQEVRYELPVEDGLIVVPNGGRALSDLLQFVNDRFYRGLITGQAYVAESARKRAR